VRAVRERLQADATRIYTQALVDAGLDLERALQLEAAYVHLTDSGRSLGELKASGKLDDAVRAVDAEVIRKAISDKLQRVVEECVVLAHLDHTRMDDPTVTPAWIFYAGLASRYKTDEPHSLGRLLKGVAPTVDLVDGWEEPDSLVLYRAALGVPVYWFRRVTEELAVAYRKVKAARGRGYPLHIDAAFEDDDDLPDLDPLALKRARERAEADAAARGLAESRSELVRSFVLCSLAGSITGADGQWHWRMRGHGQPLAERRSDAIEAFAALERGLRDDMVGEARRSWQARSVEKTDRVGLAADLGTHEERLNGTYYEAVAQGWDAEARYLDEERAAVRLMKGELEA
jgi:hypothetical protein